MHSFSSGSSSSSFWIFVVETVALGSASIIFSPFSFPLSSSNSKSEHASDFEAFSSATSDCLAQHSLMLWVELLWNSHHFSCPSLASRCFSLLTAWWVFLGYLALTLSFVLRFGGTFPLLQIHRSKVSLLYFKLLLDLDGVSVCHAQTRRCPGTPSHLGCTCVGSHSTWVPNFSLNPWYPTLCEGYEKHW